MAQHLIASNATIKAVKPGGTLSRLTDGGGLYLRLFVKGGSHGWRFDDSLNGRHNTLSLGTYPWRNGCSAGARHPTEARRLRGRRDTTLSDWRAGRAGPITSSC